MSVFYKLFSNCIITKGFTKGLIQDLQRGKIHATDLTLANYLEKNETFNFSEFNKKDREFYKSFLQENELIFDVSQLDPNLFPKISTQFTQASFVHTIEIDYSNLFQIKKSFLTDLLVKHIVIHIPESQTEFNLNKIDTFIENTAIEFYSIIIKYKNYVKLKSTLEKAARISQILITNAKKEELNGIKRFIKENNYIHAINQPDIPVYTEALNHNLYYNGRIHILSLNKFHFGDGKTLPLKTAKDIKTILEKEANNTNFIWNINNDKIEICSQCEYKNLCSNKIIPIKTKNGKFIRKSTCNYNPYIGKWREEKHFVELNEIGTATYKQDQSIDLKKVEKLNQTIWST